MNTSLLSRPSSSALAVLLFLSAYGGGYFWFRQLHTYRISPPASSIVIIRPGPIDTLLLALFYPALCLDAKFGPAYAFYWDRGTSSMPKADSRYYPFSPLPTFEWSSAANHAPEGPNDVIEELPLISK